MSGIINIILAVPIVQLVLKIRSKKENKYD